MIQTHSKEVSPVDPNIAAWMIGGGPRIELASVRRDREQLHAYLDSQRDLATQSGPGLVARIARIVRPAPACPDPACCPA
jgi:hypothetical protein